MSLEFIPSGEPVPPPYVLCDGTETGTQGRSKKAGLAGGKARHGLKKGKKTTTTKI
jgi:hypothetical protein